MINEPNVIAEALYQLAESFLSDRVKAFNNNDIDTMRQYIETRGVSGWEGKPDDYVRELFRMTMAVDWQHVKHRLEEKMNKRISQEAGTLVDWHRENVPVNEKLEDKQNETAS